MDAFQFFIITGIVFLANGCTPALARHIGAYLVILSLIVKYMTDNGYV
jgi:hypothetical protein